ncbi:MAG: hypothetical protein KDD66_02715 [Bdellovibrionales bacterium]|nr:hypothetical protein [Bdellovibrionales bacterium]
MEVPPDTYWDLFAAYSALWLIIVIACWRLMGRYKQLADRLSLLEDRVQRAADELPDN